MKTILTSFFALSLLFILGGCEPTDPAIIKVFVRSSSNQLIDGAKVIIVGDQQSTPATLAYVDTAYTNSSGFTSFDMDPYFAVSGESNKTGYFDIIVKYNNKTAYGYTRAKVHTTAVETIYLPN
ncbi:MAG: hypothetical protein RI948_1706 [Bacteroidota bacterium]|mgnify:FL=1|jgi:hypothetical protein